MKQSCLRMLLYIGWLLKIPNPPQPFLMLTLNKKNVFLANFVISVLKQLQIESTTLQISSTSFWTNATAENSACGKLHVMYRLSLLQTVFVMNSIHYITAKCFAKMQNKIGKILFMSLNVKVKDINMYGQDNYIRCITCYNGVNHVWH